MVECFGHVPPGACWGIYLPGNSPSKSNDASLPLEFGRKITTSRNTFPIPGVLVFWFQFRPLFLLPGRREADKTTNTTGQEGSPRARSRSSRAAGSYAGERASLYVSNYAPVLRPVCGARKATLKATIMSLLGVRERSAAPKSGLCGFSAALLVMLLLFAH